MASATHTSHSTKTRADVRAAINEAKDVPCADCGHRFPVFVMDFDHRDKSEKLFQIGLGKKGLGPTLLEIAKCDVVCANCHRIRTHG